VASNPSRPEHSQQSHHTQQARLAFLGNPDCAAIYKSTKQQVRRLAGLGGCRMAETSYTPLSDHSGSLSFYCSSQHIRENLSPRVDCQSEASKPLRRATPRDSPSGINISSDMPRQYIAVTASRPNARVRRLLCGVPRCARRRGWAWTRVPVIDDVGFAPF